ncbi:Hypothetical_protein [Hexamita inflata]|uniref:Hypothetical_protein n=1 Tax=Hexamita inflata TaxID=28002 RepID=A0AA86QZV8_9EUKA|nr:Hypothetical protein HINF_LOCUS50708 [Hexamita inflata]
MCISYTKLFPNIFHQQKQEMQKQKDIFRQFTASHSQISTSSHRSRMSYISALIWFDWDSSVIPTLSAMLELLSKAPSSMLLAGLLRIVIFIFVFRQNLEVLSSTLLRLLQKPKDDFIQEVEIIINQNRTWLQLRVIQKNKLRELNNSRMHKLYRSTLMMQAKDTRNIMIVERLPKRRKLKISLNHQTPTMISISHTMHSFKELYWMMKCLTKSQRQSLQIKTINIPSNMMHATNATSVTKMLK